MDFTPLIGSITTAVLSIGAVSIFAAKVLPKAFKYVMVAKDALQLASDAIEALEDKNLTQDEIAKIKTDYAKIIADFKSA